MHLGTRQRGYPRSAHLRRKVGAFSIGGKPSPVITDGKAREPVSKLRMKFPGLILGMLALPAPGARLWFSLLLFFSLVLGAASSAEAGTVFCSDFTQVGPNAYVVDGLNPAHAALIDSASTFGIDANCTIKNFPLSSGGFPITNINYQFWGDATYYINFDDVYYTGNMSCNDPTQATFWI
jgi:hypothetical protein